MVRFWWLKSIGGPGSLGFFVLVAALGLVLFARNRTRRIGRIVLSGLAVCYVLLSLPVVGHFIAAAPPVSSPRDAAVSGVTDLFVFDGDNRQARAAFAVDVDRVMQAKSIWVLGFNDMREAVRTAGVEPDRIRIGYSTGMTTDAQVRQLSQLMGHYRIERAIAIASRLQVPRLRGLIARSGLNVTVLGSPVDDEPASHGIRMAVPSLSALNYGRDAIYERVAVIYYWWKGWI